MDILVMGGTEFVSFSLVKHLISKGYNVDILTRGLRSVKCDGIREHLIADRKCDKAFKEALSDRKYDVIYDISAYTLEDVKLLCSAIDKSKIKRYFFCSSGAVYTPSLEPVAEDFLRGENPNWGAYGLNKKLAEDYLLDIALKFNFPITIFRPSYIYGEGNNLYREAYLFDRINEGKDIPIPYGNDSRVQFIHIDDLVRIFESAIHNEQSIGKAYNVTHPQVIIWDSLMNIAMEIVGKSVQIVNVDAQAMEALKLIHVRQFFPFRDVTYLLEIEQLRRDGLYVPKIDLKEGLKRVYKWYKMSKPAIKDRNMNKVDTALSIS